MKIKIKVIISILLFVIMNSLNSAQQDQSNSITMQQFREKLENDKEIIVLDVRTEEELAGPLGKIEKTINIPIQVLEQRITELEPYKDKEIFVICRTQNRSAVAVSILKKNGYKAKYVLGGIAAYKEG
jgi:rhodanese-related sulfurtransferase